MPPDLPALVDNDVDAFVYDDGDDDARVVDSVPQQQQRLLFVPSAATAPKRDDRASSHEAEIPGTPTPPPAADRGIGRTHRRAGAAAVPPLGVDPEHHTNVRLLSIAFLTFATFAVVQMVFAFVGNSRSLVGDSAAMIVDSCTYLFNYLALCRKRRLDEEEELAVERAQPHDPPGVKNGEGTATSTTAAVDVVTSNVEGVNCDAFDRAAYVRHRTKRKIGKRLEIIPPLVSLAALVAVTAWIIVGSVQSLLPAPAAVVASSSSGPNVNILIGFSGCNLLLDFFNVFCFARARHFLGYKTKDDEEEEEQDTQGPPETAAAAENPRDGADADAAALSPVARANVNMCSAYTHIFADTLRSIAICVAALLVLIFPDRITARGADSVAALVVSALILCTLLPLVRVLAVSCRALRAILAEERAEKQQRHL